MSAISLPSIVGLAFVLVVSSIQLIPFIIRNARKALPEHIEDSQLPMGPTLSKGTLEEVYVVFVVYIPIASAYVGLLVILMTQLWAPILASTSMLPSGIRYYTGRFFGAVERRTSYCPLPFPVTLLIQTSVAQRRLIDRIIYHSVAFVQLLLLVTFNVWIILFLCLVDVIVTPAGETDPAFPTLSIKILLYIAMMAMSICSFYIAATGGMRWWPTRDKLSRLVPPSIANATVTKCRCKSLIYRS